MELEMFDVQFSPNSRLVRIVASELNLPLKLHPIDFSKGDNKTPEFLRLNPNGKIPVLRHGDLILWESNAIALYLGGLKPEAGLVPQTPKERAQVEQWLFWKSAHFSPAFGKIAFERVIKKIFNMGPPDEKTVQLGFSELERFAGILNTHLSTRDYVVGKNPTVADFSLAATLIMRQPAQVDVSQWTHLAAWLARIEARPSFIATEPGRGI